MSWGLEAVTASNPLVVPLHQQVRCGQRLLEDFGYLADLLGGCSAVEIRGMPSFNQARPRTLPDPCPSVCTVPGSGLWHVSSVFSFHSSQIFKTAVGAAYSGCPIMTFGTARSPPHRTFGAAAVNTRAASALLRAQSAVRKGTQRTR